MHSCNGSCSSRVLVISLLSVLLLPLTIIVTSIPLLLARDNNNCNIWDVVVDDKNNEDIGDDSNDDNTLIVFIAVNYIASVTDFP